MIDTFLNQVAGAGIIAITILIGMYAYRSMTNEHSVTAAEEQSSLLTRISYISILICLVSQFIGSSETKAAEGTRIIGMIGLVGLAIFIVFSWDRIAARQTDEEKDE